VRAELLATIVAAYAWRSKEPLLELTVALHRNISLFRVDMSSSLLLITKEDSREPALRCDAGTFFYNAYRQDLRMSRDQADILPDSVLFDHKQKHAKQNVAKLINDLGLETLKLSDSILEDIVKRVEDGTNPYA
jgi:hypothetical protein